MTINHPIDIVYTWVNNKDEKWLDKFKQYKHVSSNIEGTNNCRYSDNNELKYALRSLEKFAPWINHVYIITDNQYPDWINLQHKKLTVIDHRDIIPHEALPTFNSNAIEMCICNIPNLSDYFLYANDDTFFGHMVSEDFFFNSAGKAICRYRDNINKLSKSMWKQTLQNSVQCLKKHNYNCPNLSPHHNIDAYRKSILKNFIEEFDKEVKDTIHHKFRTSEDIEKNIFSLYTVATGNGVQKRVYELGVSKSMIMKIIYRLLSIIKGSPNDSCILHLSNKNLEKKFNKYLPALFCINDSPDTTQEDINRGNDFLKKLFPNKSSFEK